MKRLRILLFVGSATCLGALAGCSGGSNGGTASTGGSAGTNTGTGGASSQGGQDAGGTGPQVNVGPPCTPDGPALSSLPASATIATAQDMQAVTVNGADVYYIDHGKGVYRIAGGSGTPTLVVPAPADSSTGHVMAGGVLQTDGTYVYFAQDESLYRSALTNPNAELLATAANDITQVEIDGTHVYYVVSTAGTISRVPLTGGTPEEVVTAEASAQSMQLFSGTIYFVNFDLGEVGRLPAAGGSIEYLTPYDRASDAVAVSDSSLYFSYWTALYSAPMSSPKQFTELGSAGPNFMSGAYFDRIKLVGDRLYWYDSGDNAGWTKTDGSQCGLFFTGVAPKWVTDLAVGTDAVYVAVDKSLLKLPL